MVIHAVIYTKDKRFISCQLNAGWVEELTRKEARIGIEEKQVLFVIEHSEGGQEQWVKIQAALPQLWHLLIEATLPWYPIGMN